MAEPRPLASLTAGLLARKGQARPAIVRPAFAVRSAAPVEPPAVVAQQVRLVEAFTPPAAAAAGKRVALTLRLDEGRHLQLKLMAARRRKSAQVLLVEALDELLGDARSDACVCGAATA